MIQLLLSPKIGDRRCDRSGGRAMVLLLLVVAMTLSPRAIYAQETDAANGATTLRPGDVLRVQVWLEPDLSGEFLVDEEGLVTLPLLGEKRLTGIPLRRVRDELLSEYRVYLRNPSITILPLRRIHVLGEVNKPGLYEVDPTVTLAAAVALAGGATSIGDLNRIRVIRGDAVLRDRVGASEALTSVDIRSGDQIIIDRRSWFERNSTFLISVGLSIPSLVAGILALTR